MSELALVVWSCASSWLTRSLYCGVVVIAGLVSIAGNFDLAFAYSYHVRDFYCSFCFLRNSLYAP